MTPPTNRKLKRDEAIAVLDFYHGSGVHTATSDMASSEWRVASKEESSNNLNNEQRTTNNHIASSRPRVLESSASIIPTTEAVRIARELADKANTLEELKKAITEFEGCSLKKFATNTVFSDGNPKAKIMLIGEAPGASEDEQGIPFCGASGKLLDKMLASVGLDRTSIYISNTIFWRPPGNRVPSREELAMCLPFVEKHIYLIYPKLLIFCGGTATTHMLKSDGGITKLRGKFYSYKNQYLDHEIPVGILYHPSFLLRQPAQKRQAWHDLQLIREFVDKQ